MFISAMYYSPILDINLITNFNKLTSPLITALNQTLQESPKLTSPTIVAFSARNNHWVLWAFPLTDFINIKI
jgi:hypothetical protein